MSRQRPLPCDIPTEESLIGAMLIQSNPVEELRHVVAAADFIKPSHQTMWASIIALYEAGEAIDPVTVAARSGIAIDDVAPLMAATPAVSAWRTYADTIVRLARRRHLIVALSEASKRAFDGTEADDVLSDLEQIGSDALVGVRHVDVDNLYTGVEFMAKKADRAEKYPYLLPGMIRRRWRIVLVGPEGSGKGTLMRQIALHAAAGRDPFDPTMRIDAVPTLYVDCENPETTVELQMGLANRQHGLDLVGEAGDNFHLWHQDGGMDVRRRRDQARFEAVLRKTRPALVMLGPLYKTFSRGSNEDQEQVAIEVLRFFDEMRTRYNFALMIEHHLPKSQGMYRDKNPFGSSALMRWPELGLSMVPEGGVAGDVTIKTFLIDRFRHDREPSNWPDSVTKNKPGSSVAWAGSWKHGR